jgi:hypothetical protein
VNYCGPWGLTLLKKGGRVVKPLEESVEKIQSLNNVVIVADTTVLKNLLAFVSHESVKVFLLDSYQYKNMF